MVMWKLVRMKRDFREEEDNEEQLANDQEKVSLDL